MKTPKNSANFKIAKHTDLNNLESILDYESERLNNCGLSDYDDTVDNILAKLEQNGVEGLLLEKSDEIFSVDCWDKDIFDEYEDFNDFKIDMKKKFLELKNLNCSRLMEVSDFIEIENKFYN